MKCPQSQSAVLLSLTVIRCKALWKIVPFFGHSISCVDLNQLCEDVQAIARKCGKNTMDNYGPNRDPSLVEVNNGVIKIRSLSRILRESPTM